MQYTKPNIAASVITHIAYYNNHLLDQTFITWHHTNKTTICCSELKQHCCYRSWKHYYKDVNLYFVLVICTINCIHSINSIFIRSVMWHVYNGLICCLLQQTTVLHGASTTAQPARHPPDPVPPSTGRAAVLQGFLVLVSWQLTRVRIQLLLGGGGWSLFHIRQIKLQHSDLIHRSAQEPMNPLDHSLS